MNITRQQLEATIRGAVLEALRAREASGTRWSPQQRGHVAANLAIKHAAKIEREARNEAQ